MSHLTAISDFIRRLRRKDKHKDDLTGDRGRALHFHGRKEILENFLTELRLATNKNVVESGTIILIQGSQGAGKTALLHQFRDLAAAGGPEVGGQKWRVVRIGKNALHDPGALMGDANEIYKSEERTEWGGRAEVGFRGFFSGGGHAQDLSPVGRYSHTKASRATS